jgi:hypothetical protein
MGGSLLVNKEWGSLLQNHSSYDLISSLACIHRFILSNPERQAEARAGTMCVCGCNFSMTPLICPLASATADVRNVADLHKICWSRLPWHKDHLCVPTALRGVGTDCALSDIWMAVLCVVSVIALQRVCAEDRGPAVQHEAKGTK